MARPTVAELDTHLRRLTRWRSFALHLPGMEWEHISVIKDNHLGDIEEQKLDLYAKWLSVCPSASWSDVVQALEDVGQFTMAKEIKNNMSLALVPVQFENIELSGDLADRLMDLHTEFRSLTTEVKKEVEQKLDILDDFISFVEEEKVFQINLDSIQNNSDNFFNAIRPHYNFLDCYLMVNLAIILSGSIADWAGKYERKIKEVMKCTEIDRLHRQLGRFFENHNSGHKVKVFIKVHGAYGKVSMWLVKVLVKFLFDLESSDECQWFRVLPGSVELVFLADIGKVGILLDTSRKNMAFMRLVGIFQLKIGSEMVLQDKENEAFTFESSLENANKVNNPEAIFFLSECVFFKSIKVAQTGLSPHETKKPMPIANLPTSEVALSPTKDDEVMQELERLHSDFLSLTKDMKCLIESEVENKTKSLKDFVSHAQKQDLISVERFSSVETIDDFFAAIESHYTFLECSFVVHMTSILTNSIAKKAIDYQDRVTDFAKRTKLIHLVGKLQRFFKGRSDITVKFEEEYMNQTFWLFKNFINTFFSLKTEDVAQQFRVGYEGNITFLIHEDAIKLHGNRSKSGMETIENSGGPFGTVTLYFN